MLEGLTGRQSFNSIPAFTAPEVFQNIWEPQEVNHGSTTEFQAEGDLWSTGVISYYLLTGQLLFSYQRDLLAYQKGEIELPLGLLTQFSASPEATLFIKSMLASKPSHRLSARNALDHAWFVPLQQDSEPEDEQERAEQANTTHPLDANLSSSLAQSSGEIQRTCDVLLPGTIDLTMTSQSNSPDQHPQLPLPASHSLGFDSDTYKQIVRNQVSDPSTTLNNHPALRTTSFAQVQTSEPQSCESNRANHAQQSPSIDITTSPTTPDALPPYTRRRSDAAPIPITDLNTQPTKSESTHSSVRTTERLSKKFRRASKDIVPKRSRNSQDSTSTKDSEIPMSPTSTNSITSSKKNKSHIVEIPGRPQFAEGLPMFPMRLKKA